MSRLLPREAGKFIASTSTHVKVNSKGVQAVARLIHDKVKSGSCILDIKRWGLHKLNPVSADEKAVDWVFLSDVLNFSFWSDEEDDSKKYKVKDEDGEEWTGYWSWCAAINRALKDKVPFTAPKYFKTVTKDQLAHILRSDSETPIPMLEKRLEVLHEAGEVLCQKYDGSFVNMLKKCDKSAVKLLDMLTTDFTSFQDEVDYKGKRVCIWKRAQILVADIWASCQGQSYGEFKDIEEVTMFADYRIPQALLWFEALTYSPELYKKLQEDNNFKTGEEMEVEIRGCTIEAVEQIVDELRRLLGPIDGAPDKVNAVTIDHFLWDYRREYADEMKSAPFHKIRCHFY